MVPAACRSKIQQQHHASARPTKQAEHVRELLVRLACENDGWGYTRIRDVMRHLGHEIGRTTVKPILDADGIHPAPERRKHMPWSTFLKADWGAIAAMDFFKVEVMTMLGPVRYSVLVVTELESRRIEIAGIVREPYEEWMCQVVRNLTDPIDGFLLSARYVVMDRDSVFTRDVRAMLDRRGVKLVRLPSRSPNLNAFVERFGRSMREECLDRVIPLGQRHLRHLLQEFSSHCHAERPHQGLDGELIEPVEKACHANDGRVVRRERLEGLLNGY